MKLPVVPHVAARLILALAVGKAQGVPLRVGEADDSGHSINSKEEANFHKNG